MATTADDAWAKYQRLRAQYQERVKGLPTEQVVKDLLQHTKSDYCFRCYQRGMCDEAVDMIRELGRRFVGGAKPNA